MCLRRLIPGFAVLFSLCGSQGFAQEEPANEALADLIVTGQKTPTSLQEAPLSETAVSADVIQSADVRMIQDAVKFAPNTFINEFTARKLSNPFFRGIGGSPLNPGVTTYFDGVPILHGNAANLNFLNVEQIELVRGPQSTLFGRNNLGGLILVNSADPEEFWTGQTVASVGDYSMFDVRATASGPLSDTAGVSVSGGYETRDGYHVNQVTGHDVDTRSSRFGKVRFLLQPTEDLTMRLTVSGESSHDGDYGLNDLAALRLRPYIVNRDFEGSLERDAVLASLDLRYNMGSVDFTSLTGYLNWKTSNITDLDYSAAPGITRRDEEEGDQFTQELRFSSAADSPMIIGNGAGLSWQAGLFLFTQDYAQAATNQINPPFGGPVPFPFATTTTADLEDFGLGLYLHGTLRLADRLDLTAGVRGDYEEKEAAVGAFNSAPSVLGPARNQFLSDEYTSVSPTFAAGLDLTGNLRLYTTAAQGYRAGGFNPLSPNGFNSYEEETSWNYEGGLKGKWQDGRVQASAAFFYTHWDDVQINVPNPTIPSGYYVDNLGRAASKGIELDLRLRPCENFSAYAAFGVVDTAFLSGSLGGNGNLIDGHKLPYAPDYTASTGAEVSFPVGESGLELYARGDVSWIGQYVYDISNTLGQDAYTLADFRLGLRKEAWFLEGWVRNAFDEVYVPIAFPFQLAPSGYLGENGAPATFGLRFGLEF